METLESRKLLAGDIGAAATTTSQVDETQIPASFNRYSWNDEHLDTDSNFKVTPADALKVINHLGRAEAPYDAQMDVNQDGVVTPLDPLLIINALHRNQERGRLAVQQAIDQLAERLLISPEEVRVLSVSEATWPDSSLGIGYGIGLTVMTPGLKILLSGDHGIFEYRVASWGLNPTPRLALSSVVVAPNDDADVMTPRQSGPDEMAWKTEQVEAAKRDLGRLLSVETLAFDVVSVEPVWFDDYGRGVGHGEYAATAEAGFRIVLEFELHRSREHSEVLSFEYRAIDAPLLVLHNLPEMWR